MVIGSKNKYKKSEPKHNRFVNFINHLNHNIDSRLNYVKGKIKIINNLFLNTTEKSLNKSYDRNLYEIVFDFIFFVVQYGAVLTVIYKYYNTNSFMLLAMVFGLTHWFILKFIKNIKKSVME